MGQNGGPYTEEELGYMEQEEEWEREGLLDPAWEKQQKKVSLTKKFYILGTTIYLDYLTSDVIELNIGNIL